MSSNSVKSIKGKPSSKIFDIDSEADKFYPKEYVAPTESRIIPFYPIKLPSKLGSTSGFKHTYRRLVA